MCVSVVIYVYYYMDLILRRNSSFEQVAVWAIENYTHTIYLTYIIRRSSSLSLSPFLPDCSSEK